MAGSKDNPIKSRQVKIKLDALGSEQLDALAAHYGTTFQRVMEIALARFHAHVFPDKAPVNPDDGKETGDNASPPAPRAKKPK